MGNSISFWEYINSSAKSGTGDLLFDTILFVGLMAISFILFDVRNKFPMIAGLPLGFLCGVLGYVLSDAICSFYYSGVIVYIASYSVMFVCLIAGIFCGNIIAKNI